MTDSSLTYENFLDRLIAFYEQGAHAAALELIETAGEHLPEAASQMLAWRCAMLARLGRVDEAMLALQEADARGYWYSEQALRGDPDFAALQDHPGFNDLVNRLSARRLTAVAQIRPERKLTLPTGPGSHPLCLVLHGNSSHILETDPHWQSVATLQGWALASLQSSQPGWTNGIYVWNNVARALDEVQAHLVELAESAEVDPANLIAGGFSMGAHVAVYMALDPRFAMRGVIAHEAWFNEEAMAALAQAIQTAERNPSRLVLIAGKENEEYAAMANTIYDLLTRRGFACKRIASGNSRHGYPADFDAVLNEAIGWIVNGT